MGNKTLFVIWGGLFILCAILGFIPPVSGFGSFLLILAAVVFFVPPWILFYRGSKEKDLSLLAVLRGISITSLVTTLILLVLTILVTGAVETVGISEAASVFMYGVLAVLSTPMFCSQFWVGSLFVWACLFFASISAIQKLKKQLSCQ